MLYVSLFRDFLFFKALTTAPCTPRRWVEQPIGTGFSQGQMDMSNEHQLAAEFAGFMQQFLEVFSELKGKNFYVTGESYAGLYVPCEFLVSSRWLLMLIARPRLRYCELSLRKSDGR